MKTLKTIQTKHNIGGIDHGGIESKEARAADLHDEALDRPANGISSQAAACCFTFSYSAG